MNDHHQYSPTARAALILSPDPLAAALVGAAVELGGLRPAFARSGESAREALGRTRPAVMLVDVDEPSGKDEALLGPAMMLATRLFFFGSARGAHDLEPFAARYRARVIVFPRDIDALAEILAAPADRRELLPG